MIMLLLLLLQILNLMIMLLLLLLQLLNLMIMLLIPYLRRLLHGGQIGAAALVLQRQ
jgi:hypothetical protein